VSRTAVRQIQITRAVKAAQAAGLTVTRVEIDRDGKIVVVSGKGEQQETLTPLDAWRAKKHAHPA
jgi:hypothetical protein